MLLIRAWVSCASLWFCSNILQTTASTNLPSGNQSSPVIIDQTDSKVGETVPSSSRLSPNSTKNGAASTAVPLYVTPVFSKGSAGAIYTPGHSVTVPDKCPNSGKSMDLMVLIISAQSHFAARMAIRQTWGHFGHRRDVGIVFVIGNSSDGQFEKKLEEEQDMYGDIVRSKSIDTYNNLTLKVLSLLEWVDTYCADVRFVLKTDDDMFINVPELLTFIKRHESDTNVIFGNLQNNSTPFRNEDSKYFVSLAEYNCTTYPVYVTGQAYLISGDVVHNLYAAGLEETFFKFEDVFVTGFVAGKLGVRRVHSNSFADIRKSDNPCELQGKIDIHGVSYSEQFHIWAKLQDGQTKC